MNQQIKKVIEALEKNNIAGICAETPQQVQTIVQQMLHHKAVIAAGGSVSLNECGVWDLINNPCYDFRDRNRNGITPEERNKVFKDCIGADFYFCSANAVTENGELLNVDGFCNRIASIAFGPKKVVMIVGKNKIVKDLNEAFLRVKRVAAPKNSLRLGLSNPCAKLGHCVSLLNNDNPDFTEGCNSERRICANYLVSARQQVRARITVILCDFELGY